MDGDESKSKRQKYGGRKKGTPNKKTLAFREALPWEEIYKEMTSSFKKITDPIVRLEYLKFFAKYSFPDFKPIDFVPEIDEDEFEEPIPQDARGILRAVK